MVHLPQEGGAEAVTTTGGGAQKAAPSPRTKKKRRLEEKTRREQEARRRHQAMPGETQRQQRGGRGQKARPWRRPAAATNLRGRMDGSAGAGAPTERDAMEEEGGSEQQPGAGEAGATGCRTTAQEEEVQDQPGRAREKDEGQSAGAPTAGSTAVQEAQAEEARTELGGCAKSTRHKWAPAASSGSAAARRRSKVSGQRGAAMQMAIGAGAAAAGAASANAGASPGKRRDFHDESAPRAKIARTKISGDTDGLTTDGRDDTGAKGQKRKREGGDTGGGTRGEKMSKGAGIGDGRRGEKRQRDGGENGEGARKRYRILDAA